MFLFLDNLAGWKIWSLLIAKQLWKVPACLLPLLSLPSLQYVDRLLAVRSLTGGWKNSDNSEYQTKPKQLFTRVQVSWGENCPVEHWNFDSGKVKKKHSHLNSSLIYSKSKSPRFYHFCVYGSSCNSLVFGLIHSSFLSTSISWHSVQPWGRQYIKRENTEERMRPKKRKLHELLCTEMAKSRTI